MRPRSRSRFIWGLLVGTLLLAVSGIQSSTTAVAASQVQQASSVILANAEEEFIERHGDGGFTARPVFNVRPDIVAYGVKDPVDGSWLTAIYRVQDEGRQVDKGWEFKIEYPEYQEQPELDRDRAYRLGLFASYQGRLNTFEKTIPVHQPGNLWDRVIDAFNPARWARSFAGWVVEGVHGVLCSVLGRITGSSLEDCRS